MMVCSLGHGSQGPDYAELPAKTRRVHGQP